MTISTTTNRKVYSANGATTSFPYDFYILEASHMQVYLLVAGVLELQVSGYTVTDAGNPLGGTVDFTVAPAAGTDNVLLVRSVPLNQLVDYVANDAFPEETHEQALDKLTMIVQFLADEISRAPKFSANSAFTDFELPTPSARKGLMWNDTEDGIINTDIDMDQAAADAQAAASAAAASQAAAAASASTAGTHATNAGLSASTASTAATNASNSASAASTSAANALTSENNAETAETNAEAALADALVIYGSLVDVQTAASDAAASAAAASTSETNAAASAADAASDKIAAAASASSASTSASNSSGSAAVSAAEAANAAASAAAAANSANAASNSASSVASSVTTAASHAAAAASYKDTATTQASIATTQASNALTSATTAASDAASAAADAASAAADAAAAALDADAANDAYVSAIAVYGSIAAVNTAVTNAQVSETNASTHATNAANSAANAAASATSAASVVSQDLSVIDRTVFSATIVDTFLYDTSKDSDGGAWRKRCAHTSWENETLSGNWLGSAANEAAARAISGATTGSYYYDTTAAAFYTLNAGSGKTATYRGNVAQFPAKVLITVEAARVVLWDLTQAGAPMWMVFTRGADLQLYSGAITSAAALNGILIVGENTTGALSVISFASDFGYFRLTTTSRYSAGKISLRNTSNPLIEPGVLVALVNRDVNDVAMTVLPNAPVDVATGLPIPTIAVATDGGVSVIQNDGTVTSKTITQLWSATLAASYRVYHIAFTKNKDLVFNYVYSSTGGYGEVTVANTSLTVLARYGADYANTTSQLLSIDQFTDLSGLKRLLAAKNELVLGLGTGVGVNTPTNATGTGLGIIHDNPATPGNGLYAEITKDWTSGWQVGAIKGAWLADIIAETITGTELVTNGTFNTDLTGWTDISTGTGSAAWNASGYMDLTGVDTSNRGWRVFQLPTLTAGKKYVISLEKVAGAANTQLVVGDLNTYPLPLGKQLYTFTAIGGGSDSVAINCYSAGTVSIDNVSVRLADIDRSVKAKGLQFNGSITKAAVASGAALMGYSGFSAANYLEQPYNSDLDFGTGDFCIMGWAVGHTLTDGMTPFHRSLSGSTGGMLVTISSAGVITFYGSASTSYSSLLATSASAIPGTVPTFMSIRRLSGTLYIDVNGVNVASVANSTNLTYPSAVTRLGVRNSATDPFVGKMALWRASATAPTAEQIKHIYETEKVLFEANAQCCLAGTSNAVTALGYDEETDLLHVGTSYGRSAFKGLVRVSSEATPVGAITALAAGAGVIVQGGATAVDVYVPAYTLREELLRDAEQMAKFGQNLIAHDFTATASQTTFTLPVGWEIVAVYQQGSIKRETTSWTRSFDGFKWSAVLGTGATVSDWISILAKRV